MGFKKAFISTTCLIGFLNTIFCNIAEAEGDWAITAYYARLTDSHLVDTLTFSAEFEDSYLAVLALTKKIASFKRDIDLELEGQIAKHYGVQDHMEFNVLAVARWLPFPWDSIIDTSFAAGNGLSYATEIPEIEAKSQNETSQLLACLMFELSFSLPSLPHWSLVTRIHHRSGAWGLFNGVRDASNAWAICIRYSF